MATTTQRFSSWPPLAVIKALSLRGMLGIRTSIPSGFTAHQACNRAFRNIATVVGGLFISLINSPIWSQICSMVLWSGLWAGHCMTSTSSPARKVFFVQYVMCPCYVQAKNSLESRPGLGQEILVQDAKVALLVDRAIHHHQLRFAWCIESTLYHGGRADISIHFLDATVY